MGALVVAIVLGLLGIFSSLLPLSPFANLTLPAEFDTALGWLNWVLPIGDMLGMFGVWLAGAVLYVAIRYLLRLALNIGTKEG